MPTPNPMTAPRRQRQRLLQFDHESCANRARCCSDTYHQDKNSEANNCYSQAM